VAALAARALDESLRGQARRKPGSGLTGLAADFQRRLARAQSVAWLLSTAEDFRVKEVEGGKPGIPVRLLHRYVDAVMLAGAHDRVVHRTLVEVMSLLRSPASLVHPRIAAPALGAWTAGRVSRRPISVRPEGAIDD
jgi:hypothetical protein